jgi:alkaline phosphatase
VLKYLWLGLVVDLDTTALFAAAGALTSDSTASTLLLGANNDHPQRRALLLAAGSKLAASIKGLVSAAGNAAKAPTAAELAAAVDDSLDAYTALAEGLKTAAGAVGPKDIGAQLQLLNAAKSMGAALGSLLKSAKMAASGSLAARSALDKQAQVTLKQHECPDDF